MFHQFPTAPAQPVYEGRPENGYRDDQVDQRPGAWKLARFSAIAVPIAGAASPIAVYVPAIYAKDLGLSLGAIGFIFLVERLWGAVADPLIGAFSDRTRSRLGRRKPWIAAGGLVFGAATAALFFPVSGAGAAYLAVSLFLFYLGWSMLQIPFLAWSGEISGEYHQRTRVATYQMVATSIGLFAVLVLPTFADQVRPGDGRLQLALMGGLLLACLLPALALTLTAFPEPRVTTPNPVFSLRESVRAVAANPLLRRVLLSDLAVTTGQSVRGALFVFVVTIYMGRPEWGAGLFLFQYVFGIAAGPIWMKIALRVGKHRAAVAGEIAQVLINLSLLLVTPGRFDLLLALTLAQGLTQSSGNLMLRAMVADIADKHRLETGEERAGLYYSIFSLSMKAGQAVAIGIALPLVAWLGFDPARANTPAALDGLLLVFALGPALAHAVSAAFIAGYSLDENAHSEIRRRLADDLSALAPAE